jgi:Tol biopolymer transport system component
MWWKTRPGDSTQARAVSLTDVARLTHDVGFSGWPSWSPDSTAFAFSSNRSGNFEIYVRDIDGGQDVNITNDPADDVQPTLSPDGTVIAFVSTRSSRTPLIRSGSVGATFDFRTYGGDIWVSARLGGRARRLAEDGNFPEWRPDGRALAYVSGPESHRSILEVPVDGGPPKPLLPSAASNWEITRVRYSPDGRWLTFETDARTVLALSSGGREPQPLLLHTNSHAWDPTGRRVYYNSIGSFGGTRLLATDVSVHQGTLSATPSPVGLVTGVLRDIAVSSDGRKVLASEVQESLNLTRLPLTPGGGGPAGSEEELSLSGQVRDGMPSVSPDGHRILVTSNRLGEQELWVLNLESRGWERIQPPQNGCRIYQGSWAPDGQHVAVSCYWDDVSGPGKTLSIWRIALNGSGATELVSRKPALSQGNTYGEFSPDGRSLSYSYIRDGFNQLFILDVESGRERQLTTSRSDKYDARWSPDGQWIVFPSNAGGSVQAWKVSVESGEERRLTSGDERMRHVFYSPDGRWIYVQPSHRNIWRLPAEGGQLQRVTNFPESGLFIEEPSISPDGKFLVYSRSRGGSSLWLLTLGTLRAPSLGRLP